jgi:hypothetical protein
VLPTLTRVPVIGATFEILDYDIQFECPVVISTSCSSRDVLEESFAVKDDSLLQIDPPTMDGKEEGLAAIGWVNVGELSFPSVLTRDVCTRGVTTVCIGPSSDFSLENSKFGLTKDGLVSRLSQDDVEYVPAVRSRSGWSFITQYIQFGHRRVEGMEIAINTDQITPLAMSDRTCGLLFGDAVRDRLIRGNRFYKIAPGKKRAITIASLEFQLNLSFTDEGLWVDVITDPRDSRYNQIGLGYDLIQNLDIYFDSERSRIGFKASV